MVFGAHRPLSVDEMRRCLVEVGKSEEAGGEAFARIKRPQIHGALEELKIALDISGCGFTLQEVAGGYVLQSEPSCGKWLRHLLNTGRPHRLSRPALETLAIIAYRQPVSRGQIELVRGVSVDHVVRALMEMQLIRIVGRSDLPGRPFLYGTTETFLEHFGLKDLGELEKLDPGLVEMGEAAAAAARSGEEQAETSGDEAEPAEAPEDDGDEYDEDEDDDEA